MMQDSLETFTKELIEFYGDRLPNPEHYPNSFDYFVKLFIYFKKR